ncbi:MAG: glucan phosphoethanolaminetransferase (alkaline phosphatase superfamily) [Gammaproteobacteria bacterium]|jgi:glucan phosphoethanolaminetransferase (alkaline phosphatase superfamily)
MNPSYAIYSTAKFIGREVLPSNQYSYTRIAETSERTATDTHQELIILVVGETARADHFSLNGFERVTNPALSKKDRLISYQDISACATSTAISVPCMFGQKGHDEFDHVLSGYTENILDILNSAGVNILWRDNNSSSKGVASRVSYQSFRSPTVNPDCDVECRDVGMLDGLQNYVDQHNGDILIVLHQMGSHGPAYSNDIQSILKNSPQPVNRSNCHNVRVKKSLMPMTTPSPIPITFSPALLIFWSKIRLVTKPACSMLAIIASPWVKVVCISTECLNCLRRKNKPRCPLLSGAASLQTSIIRNR